MHSNTLIRCRNVWLWAFAAAAVLAVHVPMSAQAQRPTLDENLPQVEEIVVTGTRKEGLSPTATLSPVDVLGGDLFTNQANFDLTEGLSRISPSFNTQRFPIADGTSFVRPVTLRNLSPDHTLVLINGTRRHRSALVNLQLAPLGTVNQGAQAVDFQTIPSAAIKRVEVLRDGASAQYGSDAIAGVVNIILKDSAQDKSLGFKYGQFAEGDGERLVLDGNAGFPLFGDGFVNATVELAGSGTTSRGGARPDAAFVGSVVGPEQVPINGKGQRWGDPDVEAGKLFVNAGLPIGGGNELYSHLSFSRIDTLSDFFYRGPVLPPENEFTARTTLQRDEDGDFEPDDAPQDLVDEIRAQGMDPEDLLVPDNESASGFVLRNPIFTEFPGGYNPDFGADITDFAWVGGNQGRFGGLDWDARLRLARNKVDYVIGETINPALGRLSPTRFRPGVLKQKESALNADFVYPWELDLFVAPLNVAFGLELRNETYEIEAGNLASRISSPTGPVFGVGSDGFQGFPLESAGEFSSNSVAGYVDLETDITSRLSGGVALRVENFEEFGTTEDGKLSLRFDANEMFAVRSTVSTGFRAPTPGQINTLNITTSADSEGNLIPSGVFPVSHPVSRALGSVPLEPEESTSFTLGFVIKPLANTDITLDFYTIDISDRLALQNNTIQESDVPALEAEGVEDPELLVGSLANFFSNAFDSRVSGVDLAVASNFALDVGLVTVDLRHNFNKQDVSDVAPDTITESRVHDLENQIPNNRTTLTLNFDPGSFYNGYLRANYYGSWESTGGLFSPGDASDVTSYSDEILLDFEVTFNVFRQFDVAIGAQNLLDTRPDDEGDPTLRFLGVRDSLTSPFGFNGGFYYLRLGADF